MINENLNVALDIISKIRIMNDNNINIKNVVFEVNGDVFEIIKRLDRKYEYLVEMNGNYVKCAEDNTLCRNDGRCLHCGYCL